MSYNTVRPRRDKVQVNSVLCLAWLGCTRMLLERNPLNCRDNKMENLNYKPQQGYKDNCSSVGTLATAFDDLLPRACHAWMISKNAGDIQVVAWMSKSMLAASGMNSTARNRVQSWYENWKEDSLKKEKNKKGSLGDWIDFIASFKVDNLPVLAG